MKSTILDLLCISSSRGQSVFILLEFENFIFVMFLWLGSSPTISVAFPQCLPCCKLFLCCPTILKRDNIVLSVVDEFIFGHIREKNIPGIQLAVSGLFLPSAEINSMAELFSSTQKWCILLCMQLVFGLCRSGKEFA